MKKTFRFLYTVCFVCLISLSVLKISSEDIYAASAVDTEYGSAYADTGYGYAYSYVDISDSGRKKLEKNLIDTWKNRKTELDVSSYGISVDEIKDLYFTILYENPSIFYVKNFLRWSYSNGKIVDIYPEYNFESNIDSYIKKYETEMDKVVKNFPEKLSDLEKALYINEYLTRTCDYGDPDDTAAHCAYSAIVTGNPVCQGYSLAYKDIADRVGLTAYYLASDDLNHSWNIVKINGLYYYIDATFNDPSGNSIGISSHRYFLLSRNAMKSDEHNTNDWLISSEEINSSVATGTEYDNYMWKNVNSEYIYYGGCWYGFDENGNFNKYKCDGKQFKRVKTIDTVSAYFNRTALKAGVIYYSDYFGIYYYDAINGNKGSAYIKDGIMGISISKSGNALVKLNDEKTYTFNNYLVREKTDISSKSTMRFIAGSKVLSKEYTVSYNYDGKRKKPKVQIRLGGRTLVEGIDYKLLYENNVKCGKASVTAVGIGEYQGEISREFEIAAKGSCGAKAAWSFDENTGVLTISGKGAMYDYDAPKYTPWYQFGDKIKKVYIGRKITSIGNNAFKGFKGIRTVCGCARLNSIGYKAFANCINLKNLKLGANVVKIAKKSFYGTGKLNNISISRSNYKKCRKLLIKAGVSSNAAFKKADA